MEADGLIEYIRKLGPSVAVAYSGCSMRVLPQCKVRGTYRWQRTTPATDNLEITSEGENQRLRKLVFVGQGQRLLDFFGHVDPAGCPHADTDGDHRRDRLAGAGRERLACRRDLAGGGDGRGDASARVSEATPSMGSYYVSVQASAVNRETTIACGNLAPPTQ